MYIIKYRSFTSIFYEISTVIINNIVLHEVIGRHNTKYTIILNCEKYAQV